MSNPCIRKSFYTRFLLNKHSQGFTLIELLVVIIIVSVLSALALPSYLNQTAKARGASVKATLGSLNRSQHAYRYEKGTFASSLSDLKGFSAAGSNVYNYSVSATVNTALVNAVPTEDNYKVYAAGVGVGSNDTFVQVICESKNLKGAPSDNNAQAAVVSGASASASCTLGQETD